MALHILNGTDVLVLDDERVVFDAATLAQDLIAAAWENETDMVVVPVERLPADFFDLRSGVVGTVAQKCANYRILLVVLGDVGQFQTTSSAFRDYCYETNLGQTLWFLPDLEALQDRLAAG